MTERQLAALEACIGSVSIHVSRHIVDLGRVKTPAGVKEFLGLSHGQLACMTGYSRAHVSALVNYGRALTPECLEAWREVKRQAVRLLLGESFTIHFKPNSLEGEIMRPCPKCGRMRIVNYKGQSVTCQVHL